YLSNYLGWRRLIEREHNAPQPRAILLAALGMKYDQQLTVT
ncbi:MAG: IS1595 family transposase, partial [Candidatus Thermoplasmatota archaeon]|nr:IS1595 family transposase [Candidatus Thermoplasmatota archaeon]